jgi:hypothetical protein
MEVPLNKPNSEPTEGGCFCAAVRYEITGKPVLQIMCFCRDCLVSVAAGSLDDPTLFKPSQAVFTEQAPPWARIPDLEHPL